MSNLLERVSTAFSQMDLDKEGVGDGGLPLFVPVAYKMDYILVVLPTLGSRYLGII